MNKIDLNTILSKRFETYFAGKPIIIRNAIYGLLKRILYINKINDLIEKYGHLDTKQFIAELFEEMNFSYIISNRDLDKIPSEGRVICVANHPIGSLDGLALLKAFLEVRSDVKIIANDLLCNVEFIKSYLLPINLESVSAQKKNILSIINALENEFAVIIFPAAEVSRLKWIYVSDNKWNKGAVRFAKKFNAPILPIFINAKNSFLFYAVSIINKKLSMFLLTHELFNKKNKTISIKIGDMIPAKAFSSSMINDTIQSRLLRKHVYKLGYNGKPVYITEKNVIRPVDRKAIKRELSRADLINITKDGKRIYLTSKNESPETVNEVARLRELTFRKVGEGTGKMLDLDKYDDYYFHLVVWDDDDLELVGAYRIGVGKIINSRFGIKGLYTSTNFDFTNEFIHTYLDSSIELGRSFVQKKYWNSNTLNYLWKGIGAYLQNYPSIKYMFGGVSISSNYPVFAVEAMVFYFTKWFPSQTELAKSRKKFLISDIKNEELSQTFAGRNAKEDYKILKNILHPVGYSIPILYKHYSDLCDDNGVRFLDFGIDPDFENCVDGLLLVDVNLIKEEKKQKYIYSNLKKV
jgi:putative hemolysin